MSERLTDNTSPGPLSHSLSFTHPLAFVMSPSRRRHSHSFYLFVGLSSISCCNLMFALKLQASLFRRYVQSISYYVFIGESRRRTHTKYTFQSNWKWQSQNKNHVIAFYTFIFTETVLKGQQAFNGKAGEIRHWGNRDFVGVDLLAARHQKQSWFMRNCIPVPQIYQLLDEGWVPAGVLSDKHRSSFEFAVRCWA